VDLNLFVVECIFLDLYIGSSRLDLVFVRISYEFFVFYVVNPISGTRARSMRRCFVRV
jgi:hypothetical protein